MYKKLGSRIKELRSAKKYTQEYMASVLSMSRQKYARIESGDSGITLDILAKIAELLEISVIDITKVLDEEEPVSYRTGDNNSKAESIFEMLDLFYANKHMYKRLQIKDGDRV